MRNLIAERESSFDVLKALAANLHVVFDSHDKRHDVQRNGNAPADIVGEVHAVNLPNLYEGVVDELGHLRRNYVVILKSSSKYFPRRVCLRLLKVIRLSTQATAK